MKNFNWEDFKNGKIAVCFETKEKAEIFLKECVINGITWCDFSEATSFNPWVSEDVTFCCIDSYSKLEWASYKYFKFKNKPIIKWEIDGIKEYQFKKHLKLTKKGKK